jgi:hypothetical protein
MDEDKKMIKDDINFLEYPNWIIDRKSKATTFSMAKPNGKYEILSPLGLPKHFDKTVLYYLLYKLHREKKLNSYTLKTSRFEIAKNVFSGKKDFGKSRFNRIMVALKKWNALSINFDGLFYSNSEHSIRYFHIVDSVTLIKETGELTVKFNETYVKQLEETTFYKLIDFEQYKKLSRTLSARLYEILVKSFKERKEWAINIQLLAEKLTFEKKEGAQSHYPSYVLRFLKPSINEINKKTDLAIEFAYNNDTGVCIFKKVEKRKEEFTPAKSLSPKQIKTNYAKQTAACLSYFETLPVEEQKVILEDIERQPFLKYLPDPTARIFAYMKNSKQWLPEETD